MSPMSDQQTTVLLASYQINAIDHVQVLFMPSGTQVQNGASKQVDVHAELDGQAHVKHGKALKGHAVPPRILHDVAHTHKTLMQHGFHLKARKSQD
jgi:hypothetical protein